LLIVTTTLLVVAVFISTTAMTSVPNASKAKLSSGITTKHILGTYLAHSELQKSEDLLNGNPPKGGDGVPPSGCIVISFFSVVKNGTNNFISVGSATNQCGVTITSGVITFNISAECDGNEQGPDFYSAGFGTLSNGATSPRKNEYGYDLCAVCENEIIIEAPPIYLSVTASATGYYGNDFIQGPSAGPIKLTLSNSFSASAPLCGE
jgi:hypothetical protein